MVKKVENVEEKPVIEEIKDELPVTDNKNTDNSCETKPKKSKKKLIILITIGLVIIAAAVVLLLVCFNKDEDDTNKKKDDDLSSCPYEEYKSKVTEYGEMVVAEVTKYYKEHGKLPELSDIKDNIKNDDIECNDIYIYTHIGSITISECKIKGCKYNKNVTYYKDNLLDTKKDEEPKEEPKKEELKDILLSDITPEEIGANKFHTTELDKLDESSKMVPVTIKEDNHDLSINYTFSNGELKLYHSKEASTPDISYKNVASVYFKHMDCADETTFVIYTKDKIYKIDVSAYDDELVVESTKSISNNGNYSDAYSIYIRSLTCGAEYEYVVKNKNGEYITVSDGKVFNLDKINYDSLKFVSVNVKPEVTVASAKILSMSPAIDVFYFYIDKDDYIYGLKDGKLTKLTNKKAKLFKPVEGEYGYIYNLVLEDDSIFSINNETEIYDQEIRIANQ